MSTVTRMAGALALVMFAGVAQATVVIQSGNVPQADENTLFSSSGLISEGLTVTGQTNQSGVVFNFTSDETLVTPSAGQARIEAVTNPFSLLMIERADASFFETAIFNLNAASSGTVTISVLNNLGATEGGDFEVTAGGENFFTITTDAVQSIGQITISGVDLTDVRQIRIGGAALPGDEPIPEPATYLFVGLGLLAVAATARRRKRP